MELFFLQVSAPTCKEAFLQHIYDLRQVPLEVGDTYNDLFSKVEDHFVSDPDALAAAKAWVTLNKEGADEQDLTDIIITDPGMYAVFDLLKQ